MSSHFKPSVFHPFNRKDFDIFRSLSNDLLCAVLVSGKSDSAQCCLLLLCRTYKPALIFFRCFKINSVTARSRPLLLKSGAYRGGGGGGSIHQRKNLETLLPCSIFTFFRAFNFIIIENVVQGFITTLKPFAVTHKKRGQKIPLFCWYEYNYFFFLQNKNLGNFKRTVYLQK